MSLEERFRDNLEHQQRERTIRDLRIKVERLEREIKEMQENISTISGIAIQPADMSVHSNTFHSPNFSEEFHSGDHEEGGDDEIDGIIAPSQVNSPDADTLHYLGRAVIGGIVGQSDHARFSHRDYIGTTDYCLLHRSDGYTYLNAITGASISFRINNVNIMVMNSVGLLLSAAKTLGFTLGTTINEFSIDGTLSGNSDDAVPTEKAVKTYADSVSGASLTLDDAFDNGKIIDGATSYANRVQIGSSGAQDKIGFWFDPAGTGLEGCFFGRTQSLYLAQNAYINDVPAWAIINNTYGGCTMVVGVAAADYGHAVSYFGYTKAGVLGSYFRIYMNQNDVTLLSNKYLLFAPNLNQEDALKMWIDANIAHLGTIGGGGLHLEPDGILAITANTTLTGTFDITGNTTVTGTFGVTGKTTLTGDADITGDLTFIASGGGLPYGDLWVTGNGSETTVAVAGTYYQFLFFGNNGNSNNTTPDHTNDHITINKTGVYLIVVNLAFETIGGGDTLVFQVRKNNGTVILTSMRAIHEGGGGELDTSTILGIESLTAADTVEIWLTNEDNNDGITIADCNLSLVQIGG